MKFKNSKKDILKLIILLAVVFLLDRGLFVGFSKLFDQLETVGLSELLKSKADIVVFGSSRACHRFDSETIENITGKSTYNIGRDGLGVPYTRGASDVLLQSHTPETIIIEVGPESIMTERCSRQLKRVSRLGPYIDKSDVVKKMIYNQGPQQKLRYMSKAFRFNSLTMYVLYDMTKRDKFVKGYEALDKVFVPANVNMYPAKGPGLLPSQLNKECIALLRDTIRSAREKNAEVLLVTSPRWGGFAGYGADEMECFLFLQELAAQEGASYITVMQDDYPQFANPALFADVHHLNREGARVFSEIIAAVLLEKAHITSK